jgi:uncharacterized protein (TIGR02246 family)
MKRNWGLLTVVGMLAMAAGGWMIAQARPLHSSSAQEPGAKAQEAVAKTERPEDDKAIREAAQAFARAFEKGDAKAVGEFFTPEGEYRDDSGQEVQGRAALEKAYSGFFAKRPEMKVEDKTNSIRFLGKDTAVEDGMFTVRAKGAEPMSSRYSSLYVRQDGRWLIAMLKEWEREEPTNPGLQKLDWLIGAWEADTPERKVQTTYQWVANKKFIYCHFIINNKKDNAPVNTGSQVIGVDPASDRIRSWTFDSDGGIGESNWRWEGERWVIDSAGTLANGSQTTAVNFLARAGNDGLSWRSVERTLDGEKQPDIGPVKVKRTTPEKETR